MDKQVKDFIWFKENYEHLYSEYGDCYLAIENKKVIGKYDNPLTAIKETERNHSIGSFIVQHCCSSERGYVYNVVTNGIKVI